MRAVELVGDVTVGNLAWQSKLSIPELVFGAVD